MNSETCGPLDGFGRSPTHRTAVEFRLARAARLACDVAAPSDCKWRENEIGETYYYLLSTVITVVPELTILIKYLLR